MSLENFNRKVCPGYVVLKNNPKMYFVHFDKCVRVSRDRTLISSLRTISVATNQFPQLVVNKEITETRGLELRLLKRQQQIKKGQQRS